MTNFAKSISEDRFGGYLLLWGTPQAKDITGEFFTPKTKELDVFFNAIGKLPVVYHHVADGVMKSTVIGVIDTFKFDNNGVWVEAQAQKSRAYTEMIQPLLQQDVLCWSSGTLPKGKEVKSSGEITRWPVIEGSLTPTPAEFRMKAGYPVAELKSILDAPSPLDAEKEAVSVLELELALWLGQ